MSCTSYNVRVCVCVVAHVCMCDRMCMRMCMSEITHTNMRNDDIVILANPSCIPCWLVHYSTQPAREGGNTVIATTSRSAAD